MSGMNDFLVDQERDQKRREQLTHTPSTEWRRTTIRFDGELFKRMNVTAAVQDRDRSDIVNEALAMYLDSLDDGSASSDGVIGGE